jgi:hypothetical protein
MASAMAVQVTIYPTEGDPGIIGSCIWDAKGQTFIWKWVESRPLGKGLFARNPLEVTSAVSPLSNDAKSRPTTDAAPQQFIQPILMSGHN